MNEIVISFDESGAATFVLDSDTTPLTALGKSTIERASHVCPVNRFKRLAFLALRLAFGDTGAVADWTRRWSGPWQAEMVEGPRLGPYATRAEALDAERDWIRANRGL